MFVSPNRSIRLPSWSNSNCSVESSSLTSRLPKLSSTSPSATKAVLFGSPVSTGVVVPSVTTSAWDSVGAATVIENGPSVAVAWPSDTRSVMSG